MAYYDYIQKPVNIYFMKKFYLFIISLFLSTILIAQAPDNQPESGANNNSEENIQKVLVAFIQAWNIHDPHAFSMVFSEDADFTNVRGMDAHGRAGVEKFHE